LHSAFFTCLSFFIICANRGSCGSGDPVFGEAAYTICSELFSDLLTYLLTYLLTDLLTDLLRSLFLAATSSRSANSHIFGPLGSSRSCLIGCDNSYRYCEKLLSYHKGIFRTSRSLFLFTPTTEKCYGERSVIFRKILKIHFPATMNNQA
jgi:hypothetical protein